MTEVCYLEQFSREPTWPRRVRLTWRNDLEGQFFVKNHATDFSRIDWGSQFPGRAEYLGKKARSILAFYPNWAVSFICWANQVPTSRRQKQIGQKNIHFSLSWLKIGLPQFFLMILRQFLLGDLMAVVVRRSLELF